MGAMTDKELAEAADWLAGQGANCPLHVKIADEIKARLKLTRSTNIGTMPVNVDGIDRLDLSISQLAATVRKRDTEIEALRHELARYAWRLGLKAKLLGVDVLRNNKALVLKYIVSGDMNLFKGGQTDYAEVSIVPKEVDPDDC